jgi:putative ABC transport system permease protein
VALDRGLGREARALVGGDVELRSARPLPEAAERALDRLATRGAESVRIRELVGMARELTGTRSLLVEVKAIDGPYPLYGRFEATVAATSPGQAIAGGGVLVEDALLARLGVRVGDDVLIGLARFTIRGVIRREPDRPGGLALGPRMMIDGRELARTGLVQLGSRVRYRTLLRLPGTMAPSVARGALMAQISDPGVRITTFDESQAGLRRFFVQITSYLGLVGLVSLLVGGIGVAFAVRTFVRRQMTSIAILKTLGATSRVMLSTYLLQTQALGLLGSLAGAAIGIGVQPLLARMLVGILPFSVEPRADPWTIARGLAMGVLTALLAALWPLLEVRAVRPSLILRRHVDLAAARAGGRPWLVALPIGATLAALSIWQAGSLKAGGIFVAAAVGGLALLLAVARSLTWLSRRAPRRRGFAWRHGLANLDRPGGHTTGVVVALGAGVMLLMATALLEASLGRQIDHERRRDAPSFFFVDVQPDQRDRFVATVAGTGARPPVLTPIVRGRLAAVDGTPVTRTLVDSRGGPADEAAWFLIREYALTFGPSLPPGNAILRGRWWTPDEAARAPRVSVEEDAARHLRVDVGGRLAFDVQGVRVEAEITSIRKVDWQSLSTNFFVIFSPGALDGAPLSYVATTRIDAAGEATLQDAVVSAFPNVIAIPVRDVLERAAGVLGQLALAVRAVALFSIAAGLVVLFGALVASRYQRLYDSVVLRTLGATRGAVARAFAVEYGCLGAAAGVGGTALAALLAWIVLTYILDAPWTFPPATLALGIAATIAVSITAGFLATYRLLGEKPLPVLRRE